MFLLLPATVTRVVSGRSKPMRDGFPSMTQRHRLSDGAQSLIMPRVCARRER
jgi:hypothetical protein